MIISPDIPKRNALFLGNLGLGDLILSRSAISFLKPFYEKIYFICPSKHYKNVERLYCDNPNILFEYVVNTLPASYIGAELDDIKKIYQKHKKSKNTDLLMASPSYKNIRFLSNRIKGIKKKFDFHKKNNCLSPYPHIKDTYEMIGLDLEIFYKSFSIPETKRSKELLEKALNYKIVFCHTQASNIEINICDSILEKLNDSEYLIICPNKNLYPSDHEKFPLAQKFLNETVPDFINIIIYAEEIFIIDSCFGTIVTTLLAKKELKASRVNMVRRNGDQLELLDMKYLISNFVYK